MVSIEFLHIVHDVVHFDNTSKFKVAILTEDAAFLDLEYALELIFVDDLNHVISIETDSRCIDSDQLSTSAIRSCLELDQVCRNSDASGLVLRLLDNDLLVCVYIVDHVFEVR